MKNFKKQKKIALFLSFLLFLSGILLSNTYRPYIYSNHIFDYHLADTIGSWICVPSASLFFFGISNRYSFAQYICISLISFVVYEVSGIGMFDYYDLIALFVSSLVTFLIYKIYKKFQEICK